MMNVIRQFHDGMRARVRMESYCTGSRLHRVYDKGACCLRYCWTFFAAALEDHVISPHRCTIAPTPQDVWRAFSDSIAWSIYLL